jgi:alkanesulfonate monooxygenase SsuD/methylene tetrahydromethanopterin reductase-like flavin-dependent oxidoreductase (luciferase family)
MRIGMDVPPTHTTPNGEERNTTKDYLERAAMIEAAGLDGIWFGDTTYSRGGHANPDPLALILLALAGTENIEVGSTVLQIPLHNPVDYAQRLMTIAGLSRNRFTAGVGSGSTESGAFDVYGVPFEDRFKVLHANMDVIRRLLKGEQVGTAILPPWDETRNGPHLVLGAWYSGVSIKRAAVEYDGWMSSSGRTNIKVMEEGIKRYRDLGGTRAMTVTCAVDLRVADEPLKDDEGFNLKCGPKEAADRLHRVAELGFDDVCCHFPYGEPAPFSSDYLEEIRSLLPKDDSKPYANVG